MARRPPRRAPGPRRQIIWRRAVPVFALMMAALFGAQYFLEPRPSTEGGVALPSRLCEMWSGGCFPDNFILANGGFGLSLIAGIGGAVLISRFATVLPPPPPSKSQQRKMAARTQAADSETEEEEEEDAVSVPARARSGRRRRRRR